MAGLRPVVELYMVDFIAVAFDSVLNHIAKLEGFSGGKWKAPLVIRAPSGGGYGDGGQHGQSLWGTLASIPGLTLVIASTPADAYGLMTTALAHDGPVKPIGILAALAAAIDKRACKYVVIFHHR